MIADDRFPELLAHVLNTTKTPLDLTCRACTSREEAPLLCPAHLAREELTRRGWFDAEGNITPTRPAPASIGVSLIAEERVAQVSREGWTPEHDDEHADASMLKAAECYIAHARCGILGKPYAPVSLPGGTPIAWPWNAEDYKPKDPLRNLVRAGALIAAEIDRLQRAEAKP